MTSPDTKAIRAQMDALAGFTPGPWNADLGETTYRVKADGMNIATANFVTLLDRIPTDQVGQNVRLIAAAPDIHATILALCDALDAERRARAVTQANSRETWQALCATRNHLNEHFPMPSLESDLLQGPENSVFCAAVAEAVVNALAALRADNDRLRAALETFADADKYYDPSCDDGYSPRWAEFFTIGDFRRARAALAACKGVRDAS